MKLTKRQVVMILSALINQQQALKNYDPNNPAHTDFTKVKEAQILYSEVEKELADVYFYEVDEIFSMLVTEGQEADSTYEDNLAALPPSSPYIH